MRTPLEQLGLNIGKRANFNTVDLRLRDDIKAQSKSKKITIIWIECKKQKGL
jgi:hypothetical protein